MLLVFRLTGADHDRESGGDRKGLVSRVLLIAQPSMSVPSGVQKEVGHVDALVVRAAHQLMRNDVSSHCATVCSARLVRER